MHELTKQVMLHPSNYERLIRPLDSTTLKELATEIEGPKQPVPFDRLMEWDYNLDVAQNNWAGMGGVALAAITTVSHASTQKSPVRIADKRVKLLL